MGLKHCYFESQAAAATAAVAAAVAAASSCTLPESESFHAGPECTPSGNEREACQLRSASPSPFSFPQVGPTPLHM